MQKILSQLNQLDAKPDAEEINLRFLRALPSSWFQVALTLKTKGRLEFLSFDDLYYELKTLEVDIRGYSYFSPSQFAGPSLTAFVITTRSHKSSNVIEDVLHSFVDDTAPEQKLAYEDLEHIDKLDLEEIDLKWKMAMLSKVRCYKCQQRGHFAKECRSKRGNDKQRYSSFKNKEIIRKEEDSKALVSIDTLVDWSNHDSKCDEVIAAKEFGMIAGCDSSDAIKAGANKLYNMINRANSKEANTPGVAGKFALMGVTPEIVLQRNQLTLEDKIKVLSIELENTSNLLKYSEKINADCETAKKDLQTKLDNNLVQTEKWRTSSKNLYRLIDSSMSVRTRVGLGFTDCISQNELGWDDSAFSVFKTTFEDVEGRPTFHRFSKTDSMKVMPPPLTRDYTSQSDHSNLDESQMSYRTKSLTSNDPQSVTNDFVSCDDSDKSLEVESSDFASSDSSGESLEHKPTDSFCASTSSVSTSVNGAKIDSNMTNTTVGIGVGTAVRPQLVPTGMPKAKPVPTGTPKATPVPTGRPRGTPVPTGKPKGTPIPTGKLKVKPVPTGKPKVKKFLLTYTPYVPTLYYNNMQYDGDRWATVIKPSAGYSWKAYRKGFHWVPKNNGQTPFLSTEDEGIFYSRCSRSMTDNKDRLANFQTIHGGKVTFGGGEGRITGKGTIHTECLVLSKDFKLPDDSMVVLKKHCNKFYCHVITDDYSRFCWVFFLEHKNETYPTLKSFINLVENQLNKKVKAIRCDNGTEFKNAHMIDLCGSKRIKREYSNPRTPQQNRVAERKNKTLMEAARTMLADSKLPTIFWTEALITACYVLNRVFVTSPHNKTPYALLTGNIPTISHFKPFGCHVTILNTSDHLGKFDGKADEGYIVGYFANNKAYRVYNVPNKRLEETINLWFLEDKPNVQGLGHEWYFDLDYLTDSLGYKHVSANHPTGTQGNKTKSAGTHDVDSDSDCDEQVIIVPSYPSNSIQGTQPIDTPGARVDDSLFSFADKIFRKELAKLKDQGQRVTFDAEALRTPAGVNAVLPDCIPVPTGRVPVPAGSVPVPTGGIPVPTGSLPVATASVTVPAGDITVPTDDVQAHSSNSTDSMFDGEPTTRFPYPSDLGNHDPSHCIFSSSSYDDEFDTALNNVESSVEVSKYAIGTKWILKNKQDARGIAVQKKARLVTQGHRQEEGINYDEFFTLVSRIEAIRLFLAFASYMGFLVYQMDVKSAFLYGRIEKKVYVIQPKGFVDPHYPKKGYKVVKALYGHHQAPRAWYATLSTFLLKHGFRRGTIDKALFIKKNNRDIILEILHKFDLGNVRTATTPYEAPKPKSKSESDSPVNVHLYRSMIGSLMYLTALRPEIMFAVSACLQNQVTSTTSNLEVVKKIFKYLKGQPRLGLWYHKEPPLVVEAYSDSDYAGANRDRKSTTGGCQFLAEYVAAVNCYDQDNLLIFHLHSTIAALQYKAEHNKVGYLLKPTESDGYHNIIDFLRSSHIRYALTANPIIFDSLVKQFWSTATLRARELGPPSILATIDRTPYIITKDLVRSSLQLADDRGVTDLPILEIYSRMDALGYVTGGNAKKFLMYPRFLQTILGIETRVTRQYKVLVFSSKLFVNMRLNFAGNPMPLLPAMLHQAQAGEGAESSTQPKTAAGSFPSTEDAPLGGDFHTSPPRSSHTPPAGQPSGCAEDLITLTALSSVVLTLVQKTKKRKMVVSDSDAEDGTTLNVDLDALRALANAAVAVDSDVPPGSTSQIPTASPCAPTDVPAATSTTPTGASGVAAGDTSVAPGDTGVVAGANSVASGDTGVAPVASGVAPGDSNVSFGVSVALTTTSAIPADSTNIPTVVTADSPKVPVGASNKGKSPMIEEDILIPARTFRQMEEDRLGEEAAKRLHEEEMAKIERERVEAQRKRQQDVLESAKFYNEEDWLNIRAQVEANASLSKILLGDDVSKDNFPARMAALIKKKRQALAEQLFKERQNQPLTPAQQKAYMQQPGSVLEEPPTKKPKSPEATTSSMPEIPISPAVTSPLSSRTRRKSLRRKHMHNPKSTLPKLDLDAPAQTFLKVVVDEDSDDEDYVDEVWSAVVGWEILSTPLGDINALYRIDGSTKHFATLRQILHMVDRQDLMQLYGLVIQYYEHHTATGAGLLF
nr:putative ribonuclease H-like domain-containing protein [Tanacetum cinerariifolium]